MQGGRGYLRFDWDGEGGSRQMICLRRMYRQGCFGWEITCSQEISRLPATTKRKTKT